MRRSHTFGLKVFGLAMGMAALGCKDDPAGPAVSDDTGWQVACADPDDRGDCTTALDAHSGPEIAKEMEVDCYREGSGLTIRLEDPGTESGATRGRNRSILQITMTNIEDNRCFVRLTEYVRGTTGAQEYVGTCSGNTATPGTCEFTGETNSDGYDFNGTIFCPEMKRNNAGPGDWQLARARMPDEPVPLKIVNCRL